MRAYHHHLRPANKAFRLGLLLSLVAAVGTVGAIPSSKPRPGASAAASPPPAAAVVSGSPQPAAAAAGAKAGAHHHHHHGLPRIPVMGFLNAAFQHHGASSSTPSVPTAPTAPSGPQAPVRPPSTITPAGTTTTAGGAGHHGWFHHPHQGGKPKLSLAATASGGPSSGEGPHAPAPLGAAAAGAGEFQHGSGSSPPPGAPNSSLNNRFAFVNMKGFWESLRTWGSFKHYLRGLRDLVLIAKPVEHALLKTGTMHDRDLCRFIGKAVSFMVYSVVVTSVLGTWGIDTKPLITGIGISGFVVGFALKEIATNTLSGILLVVQRPFKAGWKIKVGSHTGVVLSIDSRYVRLQTEAGEQILLPSYQVYTQAIVVQEKTDKYGRPIPAVGKLDTSAAAAVGGGSTPPSKPPTR